MLRRLKRKEYADSFPHAGKSFQFLFILVAILIILKPNVNGQTSTLFNQIKRNSFSPGESLESFVEFIPGYVKVDGLVTLKLWGRVAEGFHIYSISPQGEYSPEPTQLIIEASPLTVHKPLSESKTVWVEDEAFGERLKVHKNDFWLERVYKVKESQKPGVYSIEGSLLFQICDQKICSLPISKRFSASLEIIK